MQPTGPLREGFTTGTAAAGAAKAAAWLLLTGQVPETVDTPLPGGGRLTLPVAAAGLAAGEAFATVVKDGGDDPDATHVKTSLVGPSLTLLVDGGRIQLGTWQGVFLCEFDGPRSRSIWVRWLGCA